MNVLIQPDLDGIAGERLRTFAQQLADERVDEDTIRESIVRETSWAKRSPMLNGQTCSYQASARLLADLRLLKWKVRADAYGIELESPPNPHLSNLSVKAVQEAKEVVRKELSPALVQQFADASVQRFIEELENPPRNSKRESIRKLIADGKELSIRLQAGIASTEEDRVLVLKSAVQPYLQLVPGEGEAMIRDQFTGIPLNDIWRYFRYTWSIPYLPIPGRQMFYVIRDRAHPTHAVIGIAALGNSPLMSPERDKKIGWTSEKFIERFEIAATEQNRGELRLLFKRVESLVTNAIQEINATGLLNERELAAPTEEIVARLQRRADEFASRREGALREVAESVTAKVPYALQETEQPDYGVPPVSIAVLELEGKRARSDAPETLARKLLVAKKRAFELARLLRARLTLQKYRDALLNAASTQSVLKNDDFRMTLNTALLAAKSENVGTNILEITTCGSVAPYNHLLGGKLVALLLLSPEVADDYRRRYGDRPAIISSQLKNAERTKDCTLAWLNTTSLYSLGSSQYERLRLPAGIISAEQPELRYEHIGDTEGYGTVQFSEATVQAVQAALQERFQFRGVNSIFGEGFSPKFRKLREGMHMLGFNPTILMRHDQRRRMYAIPMWHEAGAFLRGETDARPDYLRNPGKFRDATERIAEFWRKRWLASRLNHAPTLETLRKCKSWVLSERIGQTATKHATKSKSLPQNVSEDAAPKSEAPSPLPDISFWRDLAQAGPEACADELSSEQLARLHVPQPLDDFLLNQIRRGFSLVLVGNAGDGKTHLLRRLEAECLKQKIKAEFEFDATAAMHPNDVSPILRRWKKAVQAGRPFCLAANEYPLHLLRISGKGFAPVDEVNRQCEHRLAYSPNAQPDEAAREKVLVVDLSLRNPLAKGFAGPLLDRLLSQPDLRAVAAAEPEGDLAWNLSHLAHPKVRERLIELLARLAAAGHRATVRELWIWAARLVLGAGHEDRKPVRSPGRWYSSRLFEKDERFAFSALLRRLADPAEHSHPRWDIHLETRSVRDGWLIDGAPTLLRLDGENFIALKRRFYFEHDAGPQVMVLDGTPGQALLTVLRMNRQPEAAFKQFLIESINLAYCPELFPEMKTRLYLWIGHRFQEQPSHGHVSNQSLSESDLELSLPRLPARVAEAFDYQPDHLLLEYPQRSGRTVRLRVDYPLFVALEKLRQGLPRQLLPDRELNRLDAFLEQLRRVDVPKSREFFIHNHDDRTTAKILLSPDLNQYEAVKTP